MPQALTAPGPNWLLRWLVIVSVALHLGLALWVSGVVQVRHYTQIKVSMFKGKPPARAMPRPRVRPADPPTTQTANPLAVPTPPLPLPAPPKSQAPPAAPGEMGVAEMGPPTATLPAGDLAPPGLAVAAEEAAAYQEMVRAAVVRERRYPPRARQRGMEGRARVWFSIGPKGRLLAVKLISKSGHDLLDQEALDAVRRAAPFPPPPAGKGVTMELTMAFELY